MTAQQHTIQRRMVETIDRQLAGGDDSYILRMGPKKLRMVRSFVLSFILERGDRVIPYMDFPEPEGVETADPGKPSDIEVIAERLAKVEQRQDEFEQRTIKALNAHDARFDAQSELRQKQVHNAHQRIDKVAEIIGERVSGLVDEIAALRDMFDRAETRTVDLFDRHSTDIASLLHPDVKQDGAAFPTGGASTAEAATEAVLPMPQRGDRVRLEDAWTTNDNKFPDGWYDVVGQSAQDNAFQIKQGNWMVWVANDNPGLKEVRHAENT